MGAASEDGVDLDLEGGGGGDDVGIDAGPAAGRRRQRAVTARRARGAVCRRAAWPDCAIDWSGDGLASVDQAIDQAIDQAMDQEIDQAWIRRLIKRRPLPRRYGPHVRPFPWQYPDDIAIQAARWVRRSLTGDWLRLC